MARRTGLPQLAYQGVEAASPPNFIRQNRPPVSGVANKDIKNFNLGDIWLDVSPLQDDPAGTPIPYMLVSKGDHTVGSNVPTWSAFASSGGGASDFVTDAGTATEVGQSINVFGGELINTVGSGATVTVNLDRGLDGQIPIGATGSPTMYANIISTDSSINITNGANSIDLEVGGAVALQFDADSGTAVPSAGVLNVLGGNNIATSASSNNLTIDLNGTTNYAIQVGDATGSLDSLGLGTALQVLQSGGGSANPDWSTTTYPATSAQGDVIYASSNNVYANLTKDANATRYLSNTGTTNNPAWAQVNLANGVTGVLPIANGGTNASSMTNTNGVNYFDGTRIVTTAVGSATHVLTSNGIGLAPTFQVAPGSEGFSSINVQQFIASGTYTPTSGMAFCKIEVIGGGGGGGGTNATSGGQIAAGGGGGAGGYGWDVFDASEVGVSKTVTIGAGGTGVSSSNGNNGGATSVVGLLSANGGYGGEFGPATSTSYVTNSAVNDNSPGRGGAGAGQLTSTTGNSGKYGTSLYISASVYLAIGGEGGGSIYGCGGYATSSDAPTLNTPGGSGIPYGSGGGGSVCRPNKAALPGGNGSAGFVIITEFIS